MAKRTKRSRPSGSAGFTMIELMIVLAIIGLIVVMALPRLSKAPGRAKMTDAVGSLAAISAQVEAKCAVYALSVPAAINMQQFVASYPSGYLPPTYNTTPSCTAYNIVYAPSVAGSLPTICIQRQLNGSFQYGAVMTGVTGYTTDDITANIQSATCM